MVGFKTQFVIGFNGVVPRVLKLVRHKLVHQADAAPFLQLIDENARSGLRNGLLGHSQLRAAVATAGGEYIARQALGVNADERRLRLSRVSHYQSNSTIGLVAGFETEDAKVAEFRGEGRLGNLEGIHVRKYSTQFF